MDTYDAGLLNDYGGGDVGWWQDYLRAELGRAEEFYRNQHDSIVAEKDAEIERLREALRPFSEALSVYRNFSEHQLILLSEDNPKGRRLAHLLPEQFAVARAALKGDDNG